MYSGVSAHRNAKPLVEKLVADEDIRVSNEEAKGAFKSANLDIASTTL